MTNLFPERAVIVHLSGLDYRKPVYMLCHYTKGRDADLTFYSASVSSGQRAGEAEEIEHVQRLEAGIVTRVSFRFEEGAIVLAVKVPEGVRLHWWEATGDDGRSVQKMPVYPTEVLS